MIGTSDEFRDAVSEPHTHFALVEVVQNGAVVRTLPIHSGSVDADRGGRILRRFSCTIADPDGSLTPEGIRDLLAPFGVVLRIYRGALIHVIVAAIDIDDSQAAWNEGTRLNTVGDSNGDLILGN